MKSTYVSDPEFNFCACVFKIDADFALIFIINYYTEEIYYLSIIIFKIIPIACNSIKKINGSNESFFVSINDR